MPLTKITRGALGINIINQEKIDDDAVGSAEIGENITFTGDYIGLPTFSNNTARDAAITSPAAGMMCFNTAQSAVQQYTGATGGWSDIAPAPTFSSFGSGATVNEDTNTTVTINGSQFASGMNVKLVDNSDDSDITGHTALSYTLVSSAQITVTVPAATTALTSGDVVYFTITKGGIGVNSSTLTVEADPVWVTGPGTLTTSPTTTWDNVSSGNIVTLSATSSTGAVTYATSDLDADFSLNTSTGVISVARDIADVSGGYPAERTEAFNVNAITDGIAEAATSQAFNIIVTGYTKATGGTRTSYSGYVVHTFLLADSGTDFVANETISCDILVVAGGGAGGGIFYGNGGGGAGGMLVASSHSLSSDAYTIVVGDGGDPTVGGGVGEDGENSTAFGMTAIGGGGGARYNDGNDGGSGGGGGWGGDGGSATQGDSLGASGFGNVGGVGQNAATGECSGGGGGAGAAGGNGDAQDYGGAGGAGKTNNYRTGSNATYAGGGGGGINNPGTGGTGGSGGGGVGASHSYQAGGNGTDNTGSGGGGGGGAPSGGAGGSGGSGIVVIRYAVS